MTSRLSDSIGMEPACADGGLGIDSADRASSVSLQGISHGWRALMLTAVLAGTTATGCSKEPTPPLSNDQIAALDLRNSNTGATPALTQAPVDYAKQGEGQPGAVAKAVEPYQGTASNLLGFALIVTAAGTLAVRRLVPGDSGAERVGATLVAGAGTFVGGAALCAGADPTVALGLGTLANGAVALGSLIPKD